MLTLGNADAIPVPNATTGQNLYVGDGANFGQLGGDALLKLTC
jgi:hypothetical protein